MALTNRERLALELAATPYRYPAVREARALDELGLTPTSYWLLVDTLLDRPDALEAMPDAVRRLQRLRAARRDARRNRTTLAPDSTTSTTP